MVTKKEQKLIVDYYVSNWINWLKTGDRDFKISSGARMDAAISLSKLLKIPAKLFAKGRNAASDEIGPNSRES